MRSTLIFFNPARMRLRVATKLVPLRPTKRDRWGYLFIAPWIIGFLIFTAGPMLVSIGLSFTRYDMATAQPVGIDNYANLIWRPNLFGGHGDPQFYESLWNTFYYAVFAVPLGLCGSLLL